MAVTQRTPYHYALDVAGPNNTTTLQHLNFKETRRVGNTEEIEFVAPGVALEDVMLACLQHQRHLNATFPASPQSLAVEAALEEALNQALARQQDRNERGVRGKYLP